MTRVLVVGGGVAGVAAAISASSYGAEVTIAEGSPRLPPNKSLLPRIVTGEPVPAGMGAADPVSLISRYGIRLRLDEPVLSVESAHGRLRTSSGILDFDALILATGSRYLENDLKGGSKDGVFTMTSEKAYLSLARILGDHPHIALTGPLPLSLVLAEAVSRTSRVSVFLGRGRFSGFAERAIARISEAASVRGVRLLRESVDAIVGFGRVEAVVSAGSVYPCDGVVTLPSSAPSLPAVDCVRGNQGGALVDETMKTSLMSVYAVGECAEIGCGSGSVQARLHSSALVMGRAAGVNAAGGLARVSVSRCTALDLFGVELCAAGIDAPGAVRLGLDAVDFCSEEDELDVSLSYDRRTHRVYGVQVTGRGALALSEYLSLAVSTGCRMEDLANSESPYLPGSESDRSPISLTAGRAVVRARG